jgi:membrane-associated phospholipid phosphatase
MKSIVMGTLGGFPYPPAMGSGERSSPSPHARVLFVATALVAAVAAPARAQSQSSDSLRTRWPVETAVVVGALATAGLAHLIPVGDTPARAHEWLSIDEAVKRNFSSSAARTSDVLLGATVLAPLGLQLHGGFDRAGGERALVYGETLAANLALNGVTKALVGRPRPYTYNGDPAAQAQIARDPADARRSFYSGHASTAFAAAVSGAYLFSQSSDDAAARTAVWAGSLMLAGATSNLRVRAGRHFYSDVLVGAAVGSGVGLLVPALHYGGRQPHALLPAEWIAIGTAPLAGALVSQLIPFAAPPALAGARMVPWVGARSGGLMLAGLF